MQVHRRATLGAGSSALGGTPLQRIGAPHAHPRAVHSASPLGTVSVQTGASRACGASCVALAARAPQEASKTQAAIREAAFMARVYPPIESGRSGASRTVVLA